MTFSVSNSIDVAVRHEFACYFLGDELPDGDPHTWLDSMTQDSASRMIEGVGTENVEELSAQLHSAANDPEHPLVKMIVGRESVIYWLDEDCWPLLQRILIHQARNVDKMRAQ